MIGTARQNGQIALYSISLFLASIAIACRLYARNITRTRWQWNDYLIIFAYIHVLGLVIAASIAVVQGEMGIHQSSLSELRIQEIQPLNRKMMIIIPFFLFSSSFLVKISITHFYITLFPHNSLQIICKLQLILLALSWMGSIIPCFLLCQPLAYTWNRSMPDGGRCLDIKAFWKATGAIALFFDVTCVALPLPVLWSLKTSTRKKIKLTVLFGLGFVICIVTALRIYFDEMIRFDDLSFSAAAAAMCAVPEPSLGIVAGCLPIMCPIFARASDNLKSSFSTRKSHMDFTYSPASDSPAPSLPTRPHPLPLHRSDSKKLKRLIDHLYPLTPVTEVVVGGERGSEDSNVSEYRAECSLDLERRQSRIMSWSGITVMTEVRVASEKRKDADSKTDRGRKRRSEFKAGHMDRDDVRDGVVHCCGRPKEEV